eukprot:scaffold159568_cov18-Tisochrysis_lutea.AAC.1
MLQGEDPCSALLLSQLGAIIREYGVTAVHPGYGFLSENEEFCEAVAEVRIMTVLIQARIVEQAGVEWLGPRAKTMHDFALKHVARGLAENAG